MPSSRNRTTSPVPPTLSSCPATVDAVPQREENLALVGDQRADLRILPVPLLAVLRDSVGGVARHERQDVQELSATASSA